MWLRGGLQIAQYNVSFVQKYIFVDRKQSGFALNANRDFLRLVELWIILAPANPFPVIYVFKNNFLKRIQMFS